MYQYIQEQSIVITYELKIIFTEFLPPTYTIQTMEVCRYSGPHLLSKEISFFSILERF
jgi:hypothetical protein